MSKKVRNDHRNALIRARKAHRSSPHSPALVEVPEDLPECFIHPYAILRGEQPAETAREQNLLALHALTRRRIPDLTGANRVWLLWLLAAHTPLRPLKTFKVRGKSTSTRLRSLLWHTCQHYRAPAWLLEDLADAARHPAPIPDTICRLMLLLHGIGIGVSLRRLQALGHLPAPLTKRMLHRLMHVSASRLDHAIRKSQVAVLGGSPALATVINASFLGSAQEDEAFWQDVIRWLCAQSMLSTRLTRAILDYIRHQHRTAREAGRSWSMKGRTGPSMMRAVEEWHSSLRAVKVANAEMKPSGFAGFSQIYQTEERYEQWLITEITDARALADEGRALRHCVYSYRYLIERGIASIWSLTLNGERMLTIEVRNGAASIVQIRGRRNRRPVPAELNIIRQWATRAGLALTDRAVL